MSRGKLFQRGCPPPPSSPGACLAGFSVSTSPQQGRGRRAGDRGQNDLCPGPHCHFAVGMENRQTDLCTLRVPRDGSRQAGGEVGRRGISSVRVCPYTLPGSEASEQETRHAIPRPPFLSLHILPIKLPQNPFLALPAHIPSGPWPKICSRDPNPQPQPIFIENPGCHLGSAFHMLCGLGQVTQAL